MLRLVTDSTSDISPDDAAALGVAVVPLTVSFGEEQLLDGVELGSEEFYERLRRSAVTPTTSQPSPERFAAVYRELLASPGDRVLSIHLSPRWSGTLQSATLAATELGDRVVVIDSGTVSMGLQLIVRAALRDRDRGAGLEDVARGVGERRERLAVAVLLDTLAYLQRGGRIGRAQAFLGGVLKVKPLLYVADGEAHPHSRARSRDQGLAKLLELLRGQGTLEMVGVARTDEEAGYRHVLDAVGREYGELGVVAGRLGPVVGTYAGPGAVGVAWIRAPG